MKKEWTDSILVILSFTMVLFLVLSEQAKAVQVGIYIPDDTILEQTDVSFTAFIDIDTNERIPITNLTITIGSDSCVFNLDGTEISGDLCADITIAATNNATYASAALWGYDFYEGTNHTFGTGFGYGFVANVTNSADPYGELSYDITWTTPDITADTQYDVTLEASANSTKSYIKAYTDLITVQAEEEDDDSGSSSGGSSRSNIWASTPPGQQAKVWIFAVISKDLPLTARFSGTGIDEITVEAKNQMQNVRLEVRKLDIEPDNRPNRNVYQYYEITMPAAAQQGLNMASIKFTVLKTWLQENGISMEDVVLMRYSNGRWDELSTRFMSDDGDSYSFEADTYGFSYFAVASKETAPAPAAVVEDTPETIPEAVPETADDAAEEEVVPAPAAKSSKPVVLIMLVFVCLILGVTIYFVGRKNVYAPVQQKPVQRAEPVRRVYGETAQHAEEHEDAKYMPSGMHPKAESHSASHHDHAKAKKKTK
jgi:PGF-pre-PGF domain-containing protein